MVPIRGPMLSWRHETSLIGIQVFIALTDVSVSLNQMTYLCLCNCDSLDTILDFQISVLVDFVTPSEISTA